MTAWPSFFDIASPTTRATMSLAPPGANVTMILIVLSGYAASAGRARAAAPAPARRSAWRRVRAGTEAMAVVREAVMAILRREGCGTLRDASLRPGPARDARGPSAGRCRCAA